jgi:AraC family transcriptional regulator
MTIKLITFPQTQIVYRRIVGYGPQIAELWQEFKCWNQQQNLPYLSWYGISHDDPAYTPLDQCRYDAAAEVATDFVASGEIHTATLPGGLYAALEFYGVPQECPAAWQQLTRVWLPNSGYEFDSRPCFEHYLPTDAWDEATGAFGCRICIPIKAKT